MDIRAPQHVRPRNPCGEFKPLILTLSCNLIGGHVEHAPPRRNRPMAQAHEDDTARREKFPQARHGFGPLGSIEMHPYGGQHDDVEWSLSRIDTAKQGQ